MTKVKKKRLGFSKNSKPSEKEGGAGKEEAENDVSHFLRGSKPSKGGPAKRKQKMM